MFFLFKFLQYCVGFCHTAARVSHTYTYSPPFVSLRSPDSTPLGHHRVPDQAPCVTQQLLASYWRVCWITGHVALNAIPLFPRKQAPDWKYYFRLTRGQSARKSFPSTISLSSFHVKRVTKELEEFDYLYLVAWKTLEKFFFFFSESWISS